MTKKNCLYTLVPKALGVAILGYLPANSCFANEFTDTTPLSSFTAEKALSAYQKLRKKNPNPEDFAKSVLDLNEQIELKNNPDQKKNIQRKYKLLRLIQQDEIKRYQKESAPFDLRRNGTVYHPSSRAVVDEVFAEYGPLYAKETAQAQQVRAPIPWSGYWYPFRDKSIFENFDAPLKKFDRLMGALGRSSNASDWEKDYREEMASDGWEGLCDAWSYASALTLEPKDTKTIYGIPFSIKDQKALMTFAHMRYPKKVYGVVYRGDSTTDGSYQDIRPEAFHRLMQKVVGEQQQIVIVDDTAGVEVWNKPLYRYRWKIKKDPTHQNALLVDAYPWLIQQRDVETDQLTDVTEDRIAPVYKYRLYYDSQDRNAEGYRIIAGEWLERSLEDHPDVLAMVKPGGDIGTYNKEFNKNIRFVKRYFTIYR